MKGSRLQATIYLHGGKTLRLLQKPQIKGDMLTTTFGTFKKHKDGEWRWMADERVRLVLAT